MNNIPKWFNIGNSRKHRQQILLITANLCALQFINPTGNAALIYCWLAINVYSIMLSRRKISNSLTVNIYDASRCLHVYEITFCVIFQVFISVYVHVWLVVRMRRKQCHISDEIIRVHHAISSEIVQNYVHFVHRTYLFLVIYPNRWQVNITGVLQYGDFLLYEISYYDFMDVRYISYISCLHSLSRLVLSGRFSIYDMTIFTICFYNSNGVSWQYWDTRTRPIITIKTLNPLYMDV